jgi:hypothetical protein
MLLSFVSSETPPYPSGVMKKAFWMTIRILQIVLIVALCYRYSSARKEANAWWSEVAEINEKIPLMVKTIHPTFPEGARICLQNVPLVSNQRFNRAFSFRYPDTQLGGIYVKDFEKCTKNHSNDDLLSTYFFHYEKGIMHDVTYETMEKRTSHYTIEVRRLYRQPHYKLSGEKSQLTIAFDVASPCASIGIVTSLANGIAVPQGTVVAHGRIEGDNGTLETFDLIAGQDTAEWAIRFPHIEGIVHHDMPQPYRAWTVPQPDETFAVAQSYIKLVSFRTPVVPKKLFLKFTVSPDTPLNLIVDIDRILLYVD